MSIPRSIKQYLFHNGVNYLHKTHSVAYTSQEIAEVEHVRGQEFAKTVALWADENMILAMLPGDHVVKLDALKRCVGCLKISLANESEFIKWFPTCEPGAMPPFGRLFGMPLYCDAELAKCQEIEFNAGSHIDTIRIPYASFAKLENPIVRSFSERRSTGNLTCTA